MLLTVVACICCVCQAPAQEPSTQTRAWSARLGVGFFTSVSDWSVSHPYYSANNTTWETFTGTVRHHLHLEGSFELRRTYVGLRGTLGLIPQQFTQVSPEREDDLTLILAGLSAVLYPAGASATKVEPFVLLGAGGQKGAGDMNNSGFYLSAGAGLAVEIVSHLEVELGVRLLRMKYTQIDLTPTIAKDVGIAPVSVFLGTQIGG